MPLICADCGKTGMRYNDFNEALCWDCRHRRLILKRGSVCNCYICIEEKNND